jgi:hypothetical protein
MIYFQKVSSKKETNMKALLLTVVFAITGSLAMACDQANGNFASKKGALTPSVKVALAQAGSSARVQK